jgi:hypothetical protein
MTKTNLPLLRKFKLTTGKSHRTLPNRQFHSTNLTLLTTVSFWSKTQARIRTIWNNSSLEVPEARFNSHIFRKINRSPSLTWKVTSKPPRKRTLLSSVLIMMIKKSIKKFPILRLIRSENSNLNLIHLWRSKSQLSCKGNKIYLINFNLILRTTYLWTRWIFKRVVTLYKIKLAQMTSKMWASTILDRTLPIFTIRAHFMPTYSQRDRRFASQGRIRTALRITGNRRCLRLSRSNKLISKMKMLSLERSRSF